MDKKRPVFLSVTKYRFPPMAITSVLHRISGVVMFILLPFMVYLLHGSLVSAASFQHTKELLSDPIAIFFLWAMISAVLFHLIAGMRHLLMDMGYFEGLRASRITAYTVMTVALVLIVLTGVWLW